MAIVVAEVTGRVLLMRGARYAVGERLSLDAENPMHQEVLERGWAVPVAPPVPTAPTTAAPVAPPVDKMMTETSVKSQPDGKARPPRRG